MMSKTINNTVLLIDGNWLLMSRLFSVNHKLLKENDENVKKEGAIELERFITQSINIIINKLQDVLSDIIIVSDGGSWRKSIERPISLQDTSYKGNRSRSTDIDWHYCFEPLNNLISKCKELGITSTSYNDIEGDDWIWYWSKTLQQQGINTIIWSSDNDLKQLISYKNNTFIAWYNNKNGLWLSNDCEDCCINDIDFFIRNTMKGNNQDLSKLKTLVSKVNYLNPQDIVMEKIICGDNGDNIKSIIQLKKNNKTYGISKNVWNKIKEELNINNLDDFFNKKESIIYKAINIKKFNKYEIDIQTIFNVFDYNTKMVWLDEHIIPDNIIKQMQNESYKKFDLNNIYNNYKILTTYNKEQEQSIESIFDDISNKDFLF